MTLSANENSNIEYEKEAYFPNLQDFSEEQIKKFASYTPMKTYEEFKNFAPVFKQAILNSILVNNADFLHEVFPDAIIGKDKRIHLPQKQKVEKSISEKKYNEPLLTVKDKQETIQECQQKIPIEKKCNTKVPLLDRKPKNDLEKLEKTYMQVFTELKSKGLITLKNYNWGTTNDIAIQRRMAKKWIKEYGVEKCIQAIKLAATDKFIVSDTAFNYKIILSNNVFTRLLNGSVQPLNKKSGFSKQPAFVEKERDYSNTTW